VKVTNTLAYGGTVLIIVVKSFIVLAPFQRYKTFLPSMVLT